ncbi:MAG: hypothetical protein LH617_10190 [Ramlibacter sp.]|nr:hypothetical protein [Ramlibacter sp.]
MQLINKLLGRSASGGHREESQFQDSDSSDASSRNSPRRELVQVVLRDSMRRHGIPSAWIECRILSVASRSTMSHGMHVQLIVRDGADRLLAYVPAFQNSFMDEISRFDPRVGDWLFSLSWQFRNLTATVMPDPGVWAGSSIAALLASTPSMPGSLAAKDGTSPAATPVPTPAPTASPAAPSPTATPTPTPTPAPVLQSPAVQAQPSRVVDSVDDGEVLEDLQALYAIRDASLRHGRPAAPGPSGESDFEDTQRGGDEGSPTPVPPGPRRW